MFFTRLLHSLTQSRKRERVLRFDTWRSRRQTSNPIPVLFHKKYRRPGWHQGGGTMMERCEQSSLLDPGLAGRQHIAAEDILEDQVGHHVPGHKGAEHQFIAGYDRQGREAEVRQDQ